MLTLCPPLASAKQATQSHRALHDLLRRVVPIQFARDHRILGQNASHGLEVDLAQAWQQVVAQANHVVAMDANDTFAIRREPVLMAMKPKIVHHLHVPAIVPETHAIRIASGQKCTELVESRDLPEVHA